MPVHPGSPDWQRGIAFEEELPSQAFLRHLSQLQALTPGRKAFAPSVARALETRGDVAQRLAPLYGVGVPTALGGTGQTFSQFFAGDPARAGGAVTGDTVPDWYEMARGGVPSTQLRQLQQAVETPEQFLTANQMGLLGAYETPEARRDVLLASLMGGTAPMLRQGIADVFNRTYRTQQATAPETPFLSWAGSQGFF
jgi:hypothetical protein